MYGRRIPTIESVVGLARLEIAESFAGFVHTHRVAGKTYRQIAEAEGVHPSTIRSYVKWYEKRYTSADDLTPKSNAVHLTCLVCGETFTAARADARYCSSACRQDAYRKRKLGAVAA